MANNNLPYLTPQHMVATRKYEIQRTNNFYVVIDELEDSKELTLSVQSISLPEISNSEISVRFGNLDVKFAGQGTVGTSSIVLRDLIDADTEKVLYKWRQTVHNLETDQIGWSDVYKKSGRVVLFGPDGTFERVWELKGIWPTSLELGEFSYEDNSLRTFTMNLSIDRAFRVTG